ncbi:MAG TPA: hypothetical protein VF880_07785 [Actinomycetes bacterium]|jgi:hypothetical protein
MTAPILDQAPADQYPSMTTPPRRPRRALAVLAAGTLVLLATGLGVGAAVASRPKPAASAPPASAPSVASRQPEPAATTPAAQAGPVPQQPTQGKQTPGPAAGGGSTSRPPVLTDGKHDAYIRKLDTRGRTVVVDVVQVFQDKAAVEAAVQDGKSREDAQYLSVWVRNQNPRLRTLPLASGLMVHLTGGCEDSTLSQQALLEKLAENARIAGVYYYTLTVKDGAVQRIDEHLAINAC